MVVITRVVRFVMKRLRRYVLIAPRAVLMSLVNLLANGTTIMRLRKRISADRNGPVKTIALDLNEKIFSVYYDPIMRNVARRASIRVILLTQFSWGRPISDLRSFMSDLNCKEVFILDIRLAKFLPEIDALISAKIEPVDVTSRNKIYISHNLPAKWKFVPESYFGFFDWYFVTCPAQRKQLVEAANHYGLSDDISNRFLSIGYPKTDSLPTHLLKNTHATPLEAPRANSDNRKTHVMYAPTWDPGLSLREMGKEIIQTLASFPDISFSVLLHPASRAPRNHHDFMLLTGGVEWEKELKDQVVANGGVWIPHNDTIASLEKTDILITDVSSISHEFNLFRRPILFFDPSEYFNSISRDLYSTYGNIHFSVEQLAQDPVVSGLSALGEKFSSQAELAAMLNQAIASREKYIVSPLPDVTPYNLGRAAKEAAKTLSGLLWPEGTQNEAGYALS